MTVGIIINPLSGARGKGAFAGEERRALALAVCRSVGVDRVDIVVTERAGHGAELSQRLVAAGASTVVAWGGDGTVNEVAGPVIESLGKTALGIVPSGSGDGLARSMRLPLGEEAALRAALTSTSVTAIDVGYLGDLHFLNIAGVGFDAAVAKRFNRGVTRGALRYATNGLRLVWTYRSALNELELEGVASRGPKFLVAFANGHQYGNGLTLASAADLTDGWLEAVVVDGGTPMRQLWRARRLGWRMNSAAEGVLRTRLQRASVTGEHLCCHVDGETFETSGRLDVRIAPKALRIRT